MMPSMPAVARIDPKTIFTAAEWATLTRRSRWRGIGLVAHAYGLIFAAGALFIVFPNPITYLLAVMIIGARQLGLAILMHEAAHAALHPAPAVNDWVGEWLCAAPVGASLRSYRPYHLAHHRFTETDDDPDKPLSAPFPISRTALWRKIVRDLTGQTFLKQRLGPLALRLAGKGRRLPRSAAVIDRAGRNFWIVNGVLIAGLTLSGLWWAWFALWIVPMATWFPLVTRLRNIAEHACVGAGEDPFRHARTTLASWWERLLVAPYWVHYHAEHHLFMHLPAANLERAHKLLMQKGFAPRMEVRRGYLDVLALAAPKPV
jgi:fatty acid desaturase